MPKLVWTEKEHQLLKDLCKTSSYSKLPQNYNVEAEKLGLPAKTPLSIYRKFSRLKLKITATDDEPDSLSVSSFCRRIGFKRSRVGTWIDRGLLRTYKKPNQHQLRVKISALIELAKKRPHFFSDASKSSLESIFPNEIVTLILKTPRKDIQKVIPVLDKQTGQEFPSIAEAARQNYYTRIHFSKQTKKHPERWQRLA